MIDESVMYVAAALSVAGSLSYAVATMRGRARPNRVTWLLWALAALIAFGGQLAESARMPALLTIMVGFGSLLVFVVSFISGSEAWRATQLDMASGALSIMALGLWIATRDGLIAIILSIVAGALASVPMLMKAWRLPKSECAWIYWLDFLAAGLTLLTLNRWGFADYGFLAYLLALCGVLAIVTTFRLGTRGEASWRARNGA